MFICGKGSDLLQSGSIFMLQKSTQCPAVSTYLQQVSLITTFTVSPCYLGVTSVPAHILSMPGPLMLR